MACHVVNPPLRLSLLEMTHDVSRMTPLKMHLELLRMRSIMGPVHKDQKQLHTENSSHLFAYSLHNFHGAKPTIKGRFTCGRFSTTPFSVEGHLVTLIFDHLTLVKGIHGASRYQLPFH